MIWPGSGEMIFHLRLSFSIAQLVKCTFNLFYIIWPNLPYPLEYVKRNSFLQLVNMIVLLNWLLGLIAASLFVSSSSVFIIESYLYPNMKNLLQELILKFPVQCLKCRPVFRLCIPALQHDIVELQWTVRWLRESIVLTQHLDYLSTVILKHIQWSQQKTNWKSGVLNPQRYWYPRGQSKLTSSEKLWSPHSLPRLSRLNPATSTVYKTAIQEQG